MAFGLRGFRISKGIDYFRFCYRVVEYLPNGVLVNLTPDTTETVVESQEAYVIKSPGALMDHYVGLGPRIKSQEDPSTLTTSELTSTLAKVQTIAQELFEKAEQHYRSGGGYKSHLAISSLPEGLGVAVTMNGVRNWVNLIVDCQGYIATVVLGDLNRHIKLEISRK